MLVVIYSYCGEDGVKKEDNFVQMNCIHDMWCGEYELYKERLDREVAQRKKFKNGCNVCGRKWVGTLKYERVYKICYAKEGKLKETLKKEEEKVLRCTMQPLREVWMRIGMEKIDTYEGVTVKALLDSRTTEMFMDKKFVEKSRFKIEKLERPLKVL